MSQYESVIFDLDGTLTDSGEGITKSAAYALKKMGLHVPDLNSLRIFVGPPLAETFPKFGVPSEKTDEAIRYFRERYTGPGKFENKPYAGIENLLKELKKDGLKLYVATSKQENVSLEILSHFHLDGYFDQIAGARGDIVNKDDVIRFLLSDISTEKCVMVGDTKYDVIGALKLNIPCIGVAWGYGSVEEMKKAGAIGIADNIDVLKAMLEAE